MGLCTVTKQVAWLVVAMNLLDQTITEATATITMGTLQVLLVVAVAKWIASGFIATN